MNISIVKQNGNTWFVKEQTEEICMKPLSKMDMHYNMLQSKTEEICIEAVKQIGDALYCVKEAIWNNLHWGS